jgi:LSD1 subclass zinc finger protein
LSSPSSRYHPCTGCGAKLEFAPGTSSLKCPYCGAQNAIAEASSEQKAKALEHLDFLALPQGQGG